MVIPLDDYLKISLKILQNWNLQLLFDMYKNVNLDKIGYIYIYIYIYVKKKYQIKMYSLDLLNQVW